MLSWIMILAQVLLMLAALHLLRWHVLPHLAQLSQRALVLDVWGPIAVVLPMLFWMIWVGGSVRGDGWMLLGLPIACGVLACGLVMLMHRDSAVSQQRLVQLMAAIAGLVLLMLGAAHVMSIWIGQVSFTVIAVMLWLNTPDVHGEAGESQSPAWMNMAGVVMCAAGMGLAGLWIGAEHRTITASIIAVYAVACVVLTAMYAGPVACVRLGGWAAVVGVLGGLSMISLGVMVPQAMKAIRNEELSDVQWVAQGFGAYAFDAVALMLLPVYLLANEHLHRTPRRLLGMALLLAVLMAMCWRVVSL